MKKLRFVLASNNPGKIREMSGLLQDLGVDVVSPGQLNVHVDVEETGETFMENAKCKAKALCDFTGLPAIGDDSGLCVDALNGAPGVYSARYGGPELDDRGRCMLLLSSMRGAVTRAAHFETALFCQFPDGDAIESTGRCDGAIAFAPLGSGGFGYDPVFLVPDKGKTFGQISLEEKSEISHRGKAIRAFGEKLEDYLKCR
jgi:XTP/dITP diphosphohydrolase